MGNYSINEEPHLKTKRAISYYESRLFLSIFPVFVFGVIQGFRYGFLSNDYLGLVIGSVVTVLAASFYGSVCIMEPFGRAQRFLIFFSVCICFIAYLFILYLAFVRGAWGFVKLFWDFNITSLFSAVIFIAIGHISIRHFHMITVCCSELRRLQQPI
jgi:uncharacterized membrane protein YesL